MENLEKFRNFMKSIFSAEDNDEDYELSDQEKKLPQPPLEKPYNKNDKTIDLPEVTDKILIKSNILDIINQRESHRKFTNDDLSLDELSFLLWTTQGVKKVTANNYATLRTVPSGGARHPFETYLIINHVDGLKKGLYRYLPLTHKLLLILEDPNLSTQISHIACGQTFVGDSAVTFIWSCTPYRGEWRYIDAAHKVMLLDAGHVCQNLYLSCESIGCGTCAVGAYDQKLIDKFLDLDGKNEFVIYMAPVGKLYK
jgi:SagB-type dehydrogenase family enzyme